MNDIDLAQHVSFTTDGWTSGATQSYITVTAHYINDQWEMKSATLQTRPLFESHTVTNLADVLKKSVVEWHVAKSTGATLHGDFPKFFPESPHFSIDSPTNPANQTNPITDWEKRDDFHFRLFTITRRYLR